MYKKCTKKRTKRVRRRYVLNLDTMSWDKLEAARMAPVQSHGTCVLGRTKIMVFGGLAGGAAAALAAAAASRAAAARLSLNARR